MALLPSSAIPSASGGYEIDQSLRFNDDDSAYLSRTPTSSGTRTKWTYSGWVKRASGFSTAQNLQGTGDDYNSIRFETSNALRVTNFNDGSPSYNLVTNRLFRDSSAFYHIFVAMDTTQGTASNRLKLFINGVHETSFSTEIYPAEDYEDNYSEASRMHQTGCRFDNGGSPTQFFDGYLSEVHFIDGTAYDADDFGEEGDYGEWKPKKVSGLTYGTNGFYLDFADSGALGDDESGNTNDFTVTNLVASDQMLDTPTNNFATWNPLAIGVNGVRDPTFSEGNTKVSIDNDNYQGSVYSSFDLPSTGKWYWEICHTTGSLLRVGITDNAAGRQNLAEDVFANEGWAYDYAGDTYDHTAWTDSWGDTFTAGDIIGIAVDMDDGEIWFAKNGVWQASGNPSTGSTPAFSNVTGDNITPGVCDGGGWDAQICVVNFGQDSSFAGEETAQSNQDSNGIGDFYYTPPTDFLALCTSNLPDPAVIPSEHFNTVLYTGNDGSQTISGVGFQPDFLWQKSRSAGQNHRVVDVLRGSNRLKTDTTATEASCSTVLNSDGFAFTGSDGNNANDSGKTYVAWNWKAGNETLGTGDFTQGTIASTCSRNVDAGFSIVSYTGSGSNGTIGHGLSKAPEMWVVKPRTDVSDNQWFVCHTGLASDYATDFIHFDTTGAVQDNALMWNDTPPTSSVINLGSKPGTNDSGGSFICYAWHSVDGYSKVGSYTGNGDDDGTFVYTGFRPAWVMTKRTDTTSNWTIIDSTRSEYNDPNDNLQVNTNIAEFENTRYDILSNGIKMRRGASGDTNTSGGTYIYIAFAETPFKYSNAR